MGDQTAPPFPAEEVHSAEILFDRLVSAPPGSEELSEHLRSLSDRDPGAVMYALFQDAGPDGDGAGAHAALDRLLDTVSEDEANAAYAVEAVERMAGTGEGADGRTGREREKAAQSLLGYRGPPPRPASNGLVRCLLDSLSPHRVFHYSYACTSAVRLLSSLHAARPSACLGDVTSDPHGMGRLVALLSVHDEGGLCGGSPVARDCLALLACLLREDGGRDMAASSRRAMDALVPLLEWWRSQAWRSGLPAEGSADEDDDDKINELIGCDKTDGLFPLSEVEEEMMTMVLSNVLVPLVSEGNGPHLHLQRGPVPAGGSRTEGPHRGVPHRPAGCGMSPKR